MRLLVAIAAAFLLSGCWVGEGLYTAADARVAAAPGSYRVFAESESPEHPVVVLANGTVRLDNDILAFAPLDDEGRAFVVWVLEAREGRMIDGGAYGLLRRQDNGEYLLFAPVCEETAAAARSVGATVEAGTIGMTSCRFPNRASLEAALRLLRPEPNEAIARIARIPDAEG